LFDGGMLHLRIGQCGYDTLAFAELCRQAALGILTAGGALTVAEQKIGNAVDIPR
jgi:hypothetical protein